MVARESNSERCERFAYDEELKCKDGKLINVDNNFSNEHNLFAITMGEAGFTCPACEL